MTTPLRKLAKAHLETTIQDDIVLMRLSDGTMFELTGTAREVWDLIDGERDRDAIVSQLERMHGGNPEIAADTDAFLADLRQAGLVG